MLHGVSGDAGLGFCHAALPSLVPSGYHGPLVVALDSNVLIDLQEHGAALMNDEPLPEHVLADDVYAADLASLAHLLNLWLLRDIRFVVTPRSKTDAKKVSERFLKRRLPAIDAIAESLAFQTGDWATPAPSHSGPLTPSGNETGLPSGADRELVLEAQAIGAHVFLTRDHEVLERTALAGPAMAVIPPRVLAEELERGGVSLFLGGICSAGACPYADWPLPAPDIGKWNGLLSVME
jgi:hypothetical protein